MVQDSEQSRFQITTEKNSSKKKKKKGVGSCLSVVDSWNVFQLEPSGFFYRLLKANAVSSCDFQLHFHVKIIGHCLREMGFIMQF